MPSESIHKLIGLLILYNYTMTSMSRDPGYMSTWVESRPKNNLASNYGYSCEEKNPVKRWTAEREWGNTHEAALLEQPGHLLVLTFPGFSLETQVPEMVSQLLGFDELLQRVLEVRLDRRNGQKIVGRRLPALDIPNDLRCLLTLPEIDDIGLQVVFCSILNEGKSCQEDT
jgi:hypothetical protein